MGFGGIYKTKARVIIPFWGKNGNREHALFLRGGRKRGGFNRGGCTGCLLFWGGGFIINLDYLFIEYGGVILFRSIIYIK